MSTIFISYRRDDTDFQANTLCHRLRQEFGDESVFIDVDTIPFGIDFRRHLSESVAKCGVLLAVIGDRWLKVSTETGERRLDDPRDFVRIEIGQALARDIPVIPILFGDARMPSESELPESLRDLAYRHAVHIRSGRDFDTETQRLIEGLRPHLNKAEAVRNPADTAELDDAAAEGGNPKTAAAERDTDQRAVSTKVIGIDLGTTNSVVAVMENDKVQVISNTEGGRLTPSVVAFTDKGETYVGEPARRQAVTNPAKSIFSIKRFMGRRHAEVEQEDKMVPYSVSGAPHEFVTIHVSDRQLIPAEISAHVLRRLKESAEAYLGEKVTRAVITVPAYFNDSQRQATKDAGEIAGLQVCRIINEPTAAALAYGVNTKQDQKIVVFDLGGGTLDVSVLEVEMSNDGNMFVVASTCGDTHLGGDDFDLALINHIADKFRQQHGIDLRHDRMALQRLREACEKAKTELSDVEATDINLPFITSDSSGPKHLQSHITRLQFERLVDSMIDRCRPPLQQALRDARLSPRDIDQILLVGGSTRIPKIRSLIREYFDKEPYSDIDPDEVVAMGAAIQGGILAGDVQDTVLLDVTPLTLGIETEGGIVTALIERNTTIPVTKRREFSTASDNQSKVKIHVLQGERPMASGNQSLGLFYLKDIPPAKRGVPKIEVQFDIDVNGILHVSAKDVETGNRQSVQIKQAAGLSSQEIERLRRDLEERAGLDHQQKRLIQHQNRLAAESYKAETLLKQYGSHAPKEHVQSVTMAIADCRQAENGKDEKAMLAANNQLNQAVRELLQAIYGAG